jgi:hexosaminidase
MKKTLLSLIAVLLTGLSLYSQVSIIPKPNSVITGEGAFVLDRSTSIISNDKNQSDLNYLKEKLVKATGFQFTVTNNLQPKNYIYLDMSAGYQIPDEGYILTVSADAITIKASASSGIFYGIQSLLQLLPPTVYSGRATGHEIWKVPAVTIEDSPRFHYRGMMLDVSRTFFGTDVVKNYIDWMAYHKLNVFHWHLTDDNGWRVEIKKYPDLTAKGAWRGPNEVLAPSFGSGNQRYGGFYTQKEIKEIVAYATARHIEIIPEIDLPGHSKAVTATYPNVACDSEENGLSVQGEGKNVWCVGKEENFKMLDNIIKELSKLFPGQYIHIGGDEVNYSAWDKCPHCQALMAKEGMKKHDELLNYFVRRMEKIVEKHGKQMAGWDEILEGGALNPKTRVYAWRNVEKGIESVKKGQPTIMMPGAYRYFDMKQSELERGHNWAGIVSLEKAYSLDPIGTAALNEEESKLIEGVQGALWTELLGWPARFIEYQTYPRLSANAEAGWTNQNLRNWEDFNDRLMKYHYDRMFHMGIAFRITPPEAKYEDGAVKVTLPYPWAVVRFTMDESEPTPQSPVYKGEVYTDKPLKFRFATFFRDELKSITVKVSNVSYEYQKPELEIETNIDEGKGNPLTNLYDYKQNTYFRSSRKLQAGDFITYRFKSPVTTPKIIVETGIPNIAFYWVTDGYVEVSYDGSSFVKYCDLNRGSAAILPKEPVKAVRIVVTAPNDGHIAAFQDLRIE